ncbi:MULTISPECIES: glutamate--cysteine ligase [unclassified Undibacterium]|uniref:glutamate--cysteine ligase n=1 Tax=unclassified Undibacterium TaxID=2630295 RepID=UPI002AC8BF93|nr:MULTISPECIES: glutamate--cysteine ligase [unclassified Undibacterium]MEB0138924.1 glutamate--cysteine ligase [Undibacterium sp. CCC2.1]MEB0171745.1 glutamate--cysteine ligase [Undibacterium sp. CCC1.1]MEB0175555.1 glutamate--cysteine ligase [Undibacterium sp. CCC3.4]MEB0214947.1 glutamate--cysteine ligase [Undibacterium sp. 5I2]WPX44929.1 glutamate--cysteine ligase [Undibacterium sp. CCC3.4]
MSNLLNRRLALLDSPAYRPLLAQGLRGIERETLRVDAAGHLSRQPHPAALGAALTHPQITTDYAEALLEFITPAEPDIAIALDKLTQIHRFAYTELGDEMLWSQSMPCTLPAEQDIAIAWYGQAHIGMIKHVYRRGLALRYGKSMQCIAGIHYNYSLSEQLWQVLQEAEHSPGDAMTAQSENYIAMIRNFQRYSWLLMYLFGASPALAASFLAGRKHELETLADDTLYLPYATSLRMSDLGYQNNAQDGLVAPYNNLMEYMRSLSIAVRKPYPEYEKIGTKVDGEWVQINTNVLQIENEFYATIRPKRVIHSGERPIEALCARGVQYVEVRCMDVNPFEPLGIKLETARFLDAFLLFCALDESPLTNVAEGHENSGNFGLVVKQGRRPDLQLSRAGSAVSLHDWSLELLEKIAPLAALLDKQHGSSEHHDALQVQIKKIHDPALTPSAQVLQAMHAHGDSFPKFALSQSKHLAEQFRAHPPSAEELRSFQAMAQQSIAEQAAMESAQTGSFDEFITDYRSRTSSQICSDSAAI